MPIQTFTHDRVVGDIPASLNQDGVAILERLYPDDVIDRLISDVQPDLDVSVRSGRGAGWAFLSEPAGFSD